MWCWAILVSLVPREWWLPDHSLEVMFGGGMLSLGVGRWLGFLHVAQ